MLATTNLARRRVRTVPGAMCRHGDGTGPTLMLEVTDFFGGDRTRCVGPEVTDLRPGIRFDGSD
ncbi:hypothetical protein [Amycolatopsis sp. NBC_01480]|uniref:hypothetical protein n=1 Tax=Amycolatopsis sp. NBC_01480 TaxID=2903562 RepID=UPI002E2AC66B|nr:hypothetical protein [Amycolatopsis sp. NBC_01480]